MSELSEQAISARLGAIEYRAEMPGVTGMLGIADVRFLLGRITQLECDVENLRAAQERG